MSTMKQKKKGRRRRRTRTTSQIRELHPMRKRVRSKTQPCKAHLLSVENHVNHQMLTAFHGWIDPPPHPHLSRAIICINFEGGGIRSSSYTHTHTKFTKSVLQTCVLHHSSPIITCHAKKNVRNPIRPT